MTKHAPFTKELIKSGNQVNLIVFARSHGYVIENGGRRVYRAKQSSGLYFFKDNNRYFHFSSKTHSGTIDFAMHCCRIIFKEAVAYLLELELPQKAVTSYTKERGQLILPDKAPNLRRVA